MSALRSLMTGMVDYAGLFPPAGLDVATAVATYARHGNQDDAWLLGRFVAPAARLAEIATEVAKTRPADRTWPFVALVGAAADANTALAAIPDQGASVAAFESTGGGRTPVEVLEAPVPLDAAGSGAAAFLADLTAALADAGLGGRALFCETPAGGDDAAVIAAVAGLSHGEFRRPGVKLRCGGLVPEAFPEPARVARVIALCRDHDLALKCTAGLHHPLRHRGSEPDVMMHGFLNVFGAAALAWTCDLDEAALTACLAETDPAALVFDDEGFAWRSHRVGTGELEDLRARRLGGFGSCSFVEPRDDLHELGLL